METETIAKEKEEISKQQYWYTTAALTFMALVANVTKPIVGWLQLWIAVAMLVGATVLGFYMVTLCHKEYCARNGNLMSWREALLHSFRERKGAFFCNILILIAGGGLIFFIASTMKSSETGHPVSESLQIKLGPG